MSYQLKELHLLNYRSWKELHITDFDNQGLVYIYGKNGSGKSSIRSAIEYLLVDTTSEGYPLDELPHNGNTHCTLSCVIQRDSDIIEIEKRRNHPGNDNKIILKVNGDESLTKLRRSDTQNEIEKLLGIDAKSLAVSTIFSQDSPSFVFAKDTDRKTIIYDALGYERFIELHKNAKALSEVLEDKQKSLQGTEGSLLEKFNDLSGSKEALERNFLAFGTTQIARVDSIKDKKHSLIEIDNSFLKKEILSLEDELKTLTNKSEEIKSCEEKLLKLKFERQHTEKEISKLEKDLKERSFICPILKHECDILEKSSREKEEFINKEIQTHNLSLSVILHSIDGEKTNLSLLQAQHKKFSTTTETLLSLKKKLETSITENSFVSKTKEDLDEQVKNIRLEKNPYTDLIKDTETKLSKIREEQELTSNKLQSITDILPYYKFWVTGFSREGIPNLKAEGFLEAIELRTNETLSSIDSGISIELSSQVELKSSKDTREKISYTVNVANSNVRNPISLSGGERQRVKISDIFTFAELLGKFNFIFLDEVLELSLDNSGKDEIIHLLKSKANMFGSIFVISHSNQIADKFNKTYHVTHRNGESKL